MDFAETRSPAPRDATPPLLSVVVKCYNEERRIAACLESVLAATRGMDAEIIVADALSTDRTVAIARHYPVRIVRMADPADRGCGATAQLGGQHARGVFLLLVDGDMELLPGFLPAAFDAMAQDPRLAGAGGGLIEMSPAIEFQERRRRDASRPESRTPRRLSGSALYRMSAIREAGYFMNRDLYCGEELELGQRLRTKGWRLRLIETDAVKHHGHDSSAMTLLRQRWKSRYFDGYGQLLRHAWGKPYFGETLRVCALFLLVIGWWLAMAALAAAALLGFAGPWPLIAAGLAPLIAIGIRKRRIGAGAYTFLLWQFHAASFVRGLLRKRRDPGAAIASVTVV